MAPPKISAAVFFILAIVAQVTDTLVSSDIANLVKAACSFGQAVTVYLIAKGVILGLRK